MKKLSFMLITLAVIVVAVIGYELLKDRKKEENSSQYKGTVTFIEDIGHPFTGPGLKTDNETFRLGGNKSTEIMKLEDGQKLYVEGNIQIVSDSIPEAGNIRKASWTVLVVEKYRKLN